MEINSHLLPWLELSSHPAFCVNGGVVTAVNSAAKDRMIQIGTPIQDLVTDHREAYEQFENGSLYLTITVGELPCNACVTRTKDCDIFRIEQSPEDDQLQALALAAQQLRIPLSDVMTVADRLLSTLDSKTPDAEQQASQINRGLFQLLRIISNMSDAGSYRNATRFGTTTIEFTGLFDEVIEKAQAISQNVGITLTYTGPNMRIFGMANPEKLERAIYNLLSNALKYSPEGSTIEAKLTKNENLLSFSVCNPNADEITDQNFWNRYHRQPAIGDSQHGLGLGMTLISAIASAHGGTVLIDHPNEKQTRVTMTIAIKKDDSGTVRSPIMGIGDYAGGRDKALMEFAEILPNKTYENIN